MARMNFTGVEEFSNKILALGTDAESVAKAALYDGAGVVADALRQAVDTLPTEKMHPVPGMPNGDQYGVLNVITEEDKQDLKGGVGIAKFENKRGGVTTAVSFNGYARRTEKKYPKGVPLAMIARSIESGSSTRAKHPFVRPLAKRVQAAALDAMIKGADKRINEIMGGE